MIIKFNKLIFLSTLFILMILITTFTLAQQYPDAKRPNNVTTNRRFGTDGAIVHKNINIPEMIAELGDGISGFNAMCYCEDELRETKKYIQRLDFIYNSYRNVGRTLQVNLLSCFGKGRGRIKTRPPQDMDGYKRWIKFIVNRYKGGIIYYQIDSEPNTGAFIGTKEEFVRMLNTAYDSAKEVDSNVKIMSSGWAIGDLFVGNPSDNEIESLINKNKRYKEGFELLKYVLKNGKYDIASIHLGSEYNTIEQAVKWIRRYTDKPIWFDDMASGPTIGGVFHPENSYIKEQYEIMSGVKKGNIEEVTMEMEAQQAKVTVKKSVIAFTCGVERVFLTWSTDLPKYPIIQFRHYGLIHTLEQRKKPVFYTYKMLIFKLDGFKTAKKLDAYTYKFIFEDKKPIFVLWNDLGNKKVDLSPYISAANVKISHIVAKLDKNNEPIYPDD